MDLSSSEVNNEFSAPDLKNGEQLLLTGIPPETKRKRFPIDFLLDNYAYQNVSPTVTNELSRAACTWPKSETGRLQQQFSEDTLSWNAASVLSGQAKVDVSGVEFCVGVVDTGREEAGHSRSTREGAGLEGAEFCWGTGSVLCAGTAFPRVVTCPHWLPPASPCSCCFSGSGGQPCSAEGRRVALAPCSVLVPGPREWCSLLGAPVASSARK